MKKIGLVGIYFQGAYDALHANVPEGFELVDVLSKDAYDRLADCEYLISRLDIDPDIIHYTPNVRFWQRWGAGFDKVDLKAWGERGIPIATCPGVNSGIVAELAIMLMLAGYRNLLQINRDLRAGHWPRYEYFGRSFMIRGKTVGILGLGHIGKKVAALVSAFGAKVIYYDIERMWEQEEKFGYEFVDFETLLRESDIFTIHCPLDETTRGMIGADELAKMKPSCMLINTARGPIVEEAALIEALRDGTIATAGLDTYEKEPLPADHPLLTLPNVVASAHAGGNTKDNDINMVNYVYANIVAFDQGRPLNTEKDIVNAQYLKR
ncbi:MAG: 2-hydroxyacid dehydrogenase [Clostridia bacterium]|nr:2-hydroxyacid dehydrogenase [Clostridia bacterium]